MHRAIVVTIGMLALLLLAAEPAAAACCQFKTGCTQTSARACLKQGGRPALGICVVSPERSRCRLFRR